MSVMQKLYEETDRYLDVPHHPRSNAKLTDKMSIRYHNILQEIDRLEAAVPKPCRWYAAKFPEVREFFFRKYPVWGRPGYRQCPVGLDSYVADIADLGKKRKRNAGNNNGHSFSVREAWRGSWRYSSVDRYIDYCCLVSPSKKTVLYSIRPGVYKKTRNFPYGLMIDGRAFAWPKLLPCRPKYLTCRMAAKWLGRLPGDHGIKTEEDSFGVFLLDTTNGEKYHVSSQCGEAELRAGVHALRMRRKEKQLRAIETEKLKQVASGILVTFEDSIKSGNCAVGTKDFCQRLSGYFKNWEPTMLNGDTLLSIMDNLYVRRAVFAAASREEKLLIGDMIK